MDPNKLNTLKVPELKKALEERGLDNKGLKAELVDRLKEALLKEAPADAAAEAEAAKDAGEEEPAVEPAQEAAPAPEEPKAEEPKAQEPTPAEAPAPAASGAAQGAASTTEAWAAGSDTKVEEAAEERAVEADVPPSGGAEGDSGKRAREEEGEAEGADDASKRAKTEESAENIETKEGENGEAKEAGEAGDAAPPPYQPPAAEDQQAYAGEHAYAQGADAYAQHGQSYDAGYSQAYGAYNQQYAQYGYAAGGASSTIVIEVPNDKVGLVIGKAGATIKELEQRSGARVQITPDSLWQGKDTPRPIQLCGNAQQLEWCKALVSEKVSVPVSDLASTQTFQGATGGGGGGSASAAPGAGAGGGGGSGGGGGTGGAYAEPGPGGSLVVHVPNESVGLVIGKQGATIKMLESSSGARVQIAKECPPGSNMRPITVTGQPYAVEHAKSLIMGKVSGDAMPAHQPAYGGYGHQQYGGYGQEQGYGYPPHGGYGGHAGYGGYYGYGQGYGGHQGYGQHGYSQGYGQQGYQQYDYSAYYAQQGQAASQPQGQTPAAGAPPSS